jgi:hypothetical protein
LRAVAAVDIARYAGEQPTWPRKIGMFLTFLPALAFATLLWGDVVGFAYALARALIFHSPDAQ